MYFFGQYFCISLKTVALKKYKVLVAFLSTRKMKRNDLARIKMGGVTKKNILID